MISQLISKCFEGKVDVSRRQPANPKNATKLVIGLGMSSTLLPGRFHSGDFAPGF